MAVTLLSFGLRFWRLSQFDALVFDEVYFVKFAQAYLHKTAPLDAHPPLGKYFIALGIWMSTHLSGLASFLSGSTTVEITAEVRLFPFSYRWMNALVGSCVPLVVMGLAYTLGRWPENSPETRSHERKSLMRSPSTRSSLTRKHLPFVLLAGGFVAIDGLFVSESRYGLINIYIVFLGLLGHWLWFQAKVLPAGGWRVLCRVLAGVALGGAIATKWNGLGYVLSLLLWELWRTRGRNQDKPSENALFVCFIYAVLIPALTYGLFWLPHLSFSTESLGYVHRTLLAFHYRLSAGGHPACSAWFTWPLLIKPISYWYETANGLAYTVSNLGNPVLWWLSSAAMPLLLLDQVLGCKKDLSGPRSGADNLKAYLLISYLANWLPWLLVRRCTFIYLYMPAAVFGFMVLAWLLSEWLQAAPQASFSRVNTIRVNTIGWVMLGAIALAFLFWLPLSLGLPLTPEALKLRWWLRSWL